MNSGKTGIRGENEMQILHYCNKNCIFGLRGLCGERERFLINLSYSEQIDLLDWSLAELLLFDLTPIEKHKREYEQVQRKDMHQQKVSNDEGYK